MATKSRGRVRDTTAGGSHNVKLSKNLSYLLRHGAEKEGFKMTSGGFLLVKHILRHPKYSGFTEMDIRQVVENNDKQRFALETNEQGDLMIRANQGHTITVENLDLVEVDPAEVPVAIHGTYERNMKAIKEKGLSRMKRQHIHMAVDLPGESGVISGMRQSCDYLVHIDVSAATEAGLKFYQSANNVILCAGNESGFIEPRYFKKITKR